MKVSDNTVERMLTLCI